LFLYQVFFLYIHIISFVFSFVFGKFITDISVNFIVKALWNLSLN